MDLNELNDFIVRAKASTYVGDGSRTESCRPESHDYRFTHGKWSYLDSSFGTRDFLGQEVVFLAGKPVWSMNYYGRILRDDLITPVQVGQVIKASLSKMYKEGRFLRGFENSHEEFTYTDTTGGTVTSFRGQECIYKDGKLAYELVYHGGLIKDE